MLLLGAKAQPCVDGKTLNMKFSCFKPQKEKKNEIFDDHILY